MNGIVSRSWPRSKKQAVVGRQARPVFSPKALKDDATCIKDRAVRRGGVLFSNG
jgi:hypothetical protein